MLHYAGEAVNDIFDKLPNTAAGEDEDPLQKAIDALTSYFQQKQNLVYEEYQFRQAKQDSGEALMAFYTRLKQLSLTCEFADSDREIKSQIIQRGSSTKLHQKTLSKPEPDMTLQDLLNNGKQPRTWLPMKNQEWTTKK